MSPESTKRRVLTGIQPSGALHLGNYVAVMLPLVELQNSSNDKSCIFSIVDLHAITVAQDPEELRHTALDLTAWMLASGIDEKKVILFQQSHNPDHAQLMWILSCMTPMGWLERMIQFKEKSQKQGERTSTGLFMYPVLMAADILLYSPHEVPVGDDQIQHMELARDIVRRFNTQYGEVFREPQSVIKQHTARLMSLQDPTKKMSKSDDNKNGVINLNDSADIIRSKIKRAVTDSGSEIRVAPDKPAVSQLIHLYAQLSGQSVQEIERTYIGKQYGEFKSDLAEVMVSALAPVQKRHDELMSDPQYLHEILDAGLEKARAISSKKLEEVMRAVGLL